eukprot:2876076-Rhodomonas_salina.3
MHQLMTGVMAQNGICVHGLMIDILRIANVNGSSALPFELYYTTSKVVGGYDALHCRFYGVNRMKCDPGFSP